MKNKFKFLILLANFCLPFSVLSSCNDLELEKPAMRVEKNLLLEKTALLLPKTGVYDDGNQNLIFANTNTTDKQIYQYHGETANNANLAVNDADPLSMLKGKDAIELRNDDTLIVDLNFVNQYRQNQQINTNKQSESITDFTDLWYKYFTIFDTKATGAGNESWQAVNQALWTEDKSQVNKATNHKLVYNEEKKSYFASIKSLKDVFNTASEYQIENVFELKLASDKIHLFVTCHYQEEFMHDYFTFAFINLDENHKRIKIDNNQTYQKLWESSYIMCNLNKAVDDFNKINISKTGWTSSVIENLKKDKWLGYLMGTKSIDTDYSNQVKTRYYNCMLYTPAALYKDSFWYYCAKYVALGVEGFKGYSKQIEPIKIGE